MKKLKKELNFNSNITDEVLKQVCKDAKRFAYRFYIPPDEALSISYLGLCKADKKYNPNKKIPFLPYARKIILWEHQTEYRKNNYTRNNKPTLTKKFKKTIQLEDHHLPIVDGVRQLEARDFLFKVEKKILNSRTKIKHILQGYCMDTTLRRKLKGLKQEFFT